MIYAYGLARARVCVCACLSVCLSGCLCVTIVRPCHTFAKIKNTNKNGLCRFLRLPTSDIVVKIVLRDRDLLFVGRRFESTPSHNGDHPCRCDECEFCCTQSSSSARNKLAHINRRPFKCDESSSIMMKAIFAAKQIAS